MIRSYKIRLYPNHGKAERIRYTCLRFGQFTQYFANKFFYTNDIFGFSTKGMGNLANQAQRKAKGIASGTKHSAESQNHKSTCPEISTNTCPGILRHATDCSFDFWVTITNQFPITTNTSIWAPGKSTKPLNKKLRQGWKLSKYCEVRLEPNGQMFAYVNVERDTPKPIKQAKFLGIDIGRNHLVARSDGYLSCSATKILDKSRNKKAERQRQGHRIRVQKTSIKQQLDIEVNRALSVSKRRSLSLVVENPKSLSHLKSRGRWLTSYFANRLQARAEEEGIYVRFINPAYTSITCSACGKIDKQSRDRQAFKCTACGYVAHADLNAACNMSQRGSV